MSSRGAYVVIEGPEFAGKTLQSKRLAEETGSEWVREPGYTAIGSVIRDTVLNPPSPLDPEVELVLLAADKAITLERKIKPTLEKGLSVVSDRSWVSTIAYQCYGDGIDRARADQVISYAIGGPGIVDKYIFLDLDPETSKKRSSLRALEYGEVDRFESQDENYHGRVRQGYLDVAAELGSQAVIIDANKDKEAVYQDIYKVVGKLLKQGVQSE